MSQWINIKVILGAILFAVCVFAVLVWVLWSARAQNPAHPPSTAILNIIKAPTNTSPAPIVTPTPTVEATAVGSTPLPNSNIKVGDYIQVIGTGGDGLRLHESAAVAGKVRYIAIDSQVFIVKDGPVNADGYTWWLLQDPNSDNANGWGVANYLAVVPNP